jgi:FMN-dependent NADH-azoreductase
MRALFRFVGIPEVEIIRAEGVVFSPEHREKALSGALAQVATLQSTPRLTEAA